MQRKHIFFSEWSYENIIQMTSLLCSKPWASKNKSMLVLCDLQEPKSPDPSSPDFIYLTSSPMTYPHFHSLESFALAVPSAWKALSQVISSRSSWKICPHDETVPGHAGQNSSALSWDCISPLPVFFSSWVLFSTRYILFISGCVYCPISSPKYNLSKVKVFVCFINIVYPRSVAECCNY